MRRNDDEGRVGRSVDLRPIGTTWRRTVPGGRYHWVYTVTEHVVLGGGLFREIVGRRVTGGRER